MGKERLTATQKKCAELIVTRDIHGKNNNKIAEELKIDRATLYRWKAKPEFIDYMNELAEEFHRGFLADTYVELRKIMAYGQDSHKLKAIELMLKNQGRLKEVQETTATVHATEDADSILKSLGL